MKRKSMVICLVIALAFPFAACVKRQPRVREPGTDKSSQSSGERCGLSCWIKKKEEERRQEREGTKPAKPPANRKPRHHRPERTPNEPQKTPPKNQPTTRKPQQGKGVYHTVKRGETLYRICKTYGVEQEVVKRANGITDPSTLKVGQKIWIPGATEVRAVPVVVQQNAGDSTGPFVQPGVAPPSALKGKFFFPVPGGKISSGFGPRGDTTHEGVDILAPEGTPIYAAEDGKVVYADDTIRGYGNMIIIKHAGEISTVYAHNSRNLVHTGDLVRRGQKIAEVGQTGRATAPHCHFEVRVGDKPTDPMYFLPTQ